MNNLITDFHMLLHFSLYRKRKTELVRNIKLPIFKWWLNYVYDNLTVWLYVLIHAGTKGVRVPLPCVSQSLSHAEEIDPAYENPLRRETTHVWQGQTQG